MADIDITCPSCSKVVTVSEFADPEYLTCPSCGHKMGKTAAAAQPTADTRQPLVFRKQWDLESDKPGEQAPPVEWRFHKHAAKAVIRKKAKATYALRSWGVFLVLGGLMAYLRYGGGYLSHHTDMIRTYGPLVVFILYVVIILEAYRDSIFHGILATIIPFYPFYYILAVSDSFYTRAVVAGILVGIGQDSFTVIGEYLTAVIESVQRWIARGGS